MLPISNQKKGKRMEEFVAKEIEAMGLGKSIRTPGSGSGNRFKGDLFNSLPFLLEIKNEKQTNLLKNIDQAKRQAEIGNWSRDKWALITRDPRKPEFEEVYATINLWEFLRLLKKNSEPRIKAPDKQMKWKGERLKNALQEYLKEL